MLEVPTGRWDFTLGGVQAGTVLEFSFNVNYPPQISSEQHSVGRTLFCICRQLFRLKLCTLDSQSMPVMWPTSGIEIHILCPQKEEELGPGFGILCGKGPG